MRLTLPLPAYVPLATQEYKKLLDISGEVYSWWDHGLTSAAVHPQFPAQPYLYISVSNRPTFAHEPHHTHILTPTTPCILQYSSEDPDTPWNDQCYPDPKKEYLTNPPDTRPYCKTLAKIVRLKVGAAFLPALRPF